MHKSSLRSDALQLFAGPGDEILMAPRGVLCIKSCAPAPQRPIEWFDGPVVEARCYSGKVKSSDINHNRVASVSAGGLLMNAIDKFSSLGFSKGTIANEAIEWVNTVNSVMLQGDGQFGRRVCLPLEARYEPMVFSHRRSHQRNLYYRFDVLPLGAKRCCCF